MMDDLGVTPIVGSQMENDRHEMEWSSKIVGFQQCRKLSQSSMNTDAASLGTYCLDHGMAPVVNARLDALGQENS
jgi:hypothetical protein